MGTTFTHLDTVDVGDDAGVSQCLQSLHGGFGELQLRFRAVLGVTHEHGHVLGGALPAAARTVTERAASGGWVSLER